jgi:hypothetical protein
MPLFDFGTANYADPPKGWKKSFFVGYDRPKDEPMPNPFSEDGESTPISPIAVALVGALVVGLPLVFIGTVCLTGGLPFGL